MVSSHPGHHQDSLAFLAPTQATNLALLVSALLRRQILCLSKLARAYLRPPVRQISVPKHDLLYRLKRLLRFLNNERVAPFVVQVPSSHVPDYESAVRPLPATALRGLSCFWAEFLASGDLSTLRSLRPDTA